MCGIVGIVGAREPVDTRAVIAMRDRLAHRGPDDAGLALSRDGRTAFGHRRLAIIDPGPGGHQPMTNRARTLLATHNGEIYNFRQLATELKSAGYSFLTRSDTEVLITAFEHWGLDAVVRLRGMFAFALWSEEMRECVLVRDRLGIKPLYYAVIDGVLYFGSEATALLAAPAVPRDLDTEALGDYLAYGYVPGERSIWRGVRKLPPGHLLVFSEGTPIIRRYWEPPTEAPDPTAVADPAALRAELEAAVKAVMVSDVPVAAFLSGGLDSSTVVALMQESCEEPVRSYTIDFDIRERSEAAFARLVAERYATDHHERHLTLDHSLEVIDMVVASYDEPLADESIIPTYLISEEVAHDMKVVISGDGGDEVFAGYRWYPKLERIESFRKRLGPLATALSRLVPHLPQGRPPIDRLAHRLALLGGPTIENYFRQVCLFDGSARAALADPALAREMSDDALWLFRQHWHPELPIVRRLQLLDLQTYLPDDILPKVDRASMRHSLETRVPLLDHHLVEHALRLPLDVMYRKGVGKQLLREVARDLLPEPILSRPKQGFGIPRAQWDRNGLGARQAQRLRSGMLVRERLVQPAAV
jgi:asparagine synthase (glutamine-hydrolysing)